MWQSLRLCLSSRCIQGHVIRVNKVKVMGFGLVQISKMFEAMKYRLTRMVGSVLSVGSFTAIHIVWFKNQVNLIDFLRILSQWYAPMHVPSHQTMADIGALQQMGHFYCYIYCIYAEYKLFLLQFYDLIFNCLKKHSVTDVQATYVEYASPTILVPPNYHVE